MHSIEIDVDTARRRIVDLTSELELFCSGLGDGLVNAFVPHATAGLARYRRGARAPGTHFLVCDSGERTMRPPSPESQSSSMSSATLESWRAM